MEERIAVGPEKTVVESALAKRQYDLLEFLGEGATAAVYRIKDRKSGRIYACKAGARQEWLLPESELLQRVKHPLFPSWQDFWYEGEYAYLVMEYVEGENLQALLDVGRRFTEEECLQIALALADGLGYLHDLEPPVIYRDLKPANILQGPAGEIRLIDLGAAAAPRGWQIGTPGFAAPEQGISEENRGAKLPGPSADVYTMGILLQRLLAGQEAEQRLTELVERCVRPEPGERIPGMHELGRELSFCDALVKRRAKRKSTQMKHIWQHVQRRLFAHKKLTPFYRKNIWMSHYKTKI